MNIKLIGIGLLVIVLAIATAVILKTNVFTNLNSGNTNPTITAEENLERKTSSTNVIVTNNGFEPKSITIKQGDRVTWRNQSGKQVTVNSDSHPTHQLWPFLNLGAFNNTETVSVVFEKTGTYNYHNHLNPTQVGSVIVE